MGPLPDGDSAPWRPSDGTRVVGAERETMGMLPAPAPFRRGIRGLWPGGVCAGLVLLLLVPGSRAQTVGDISTADPRRQGPGGRVRIRESAERGMTGSTWQRAASRSTRTGMAAGHATGGPRVGMREPPFCKEKGLWIILQVGPVYEGEAPATRTEMAADHATGGLHCLKP